MAYELQPITVTTATTLKRETHEGVIVNLESTTGRAITLPASTGKGDVYRIYLTASVSSGSHTVVANGTDIIQGTVAIATDIAGVTCPTTAITDTITLNGGTTGGILGSYLELRDVKAGQWMVTGTLVSTGAEATPFSGS